MRFLLNKVQLILLFLSYYTFKFLFNRTVPYEWVVGVDEIASNIHQINKLIENSASVCFGKNKFYKNDYNYTLPNCFFLGDRVIRIFFGPILLGFLVNNTKGFYYIWSTGYLYDRESEFKFISSKGRKIVCHFVGSDIRSPLLYKEKCEQLKMDSFVNYLPESNYKNSNQYEISKKSLARVADKYSDLIFNAPFEQISYLKSYQEKFYISLSENKFNRDADKFRKIDIVKIVHAPSNPVAKGTPLVRAAIKKLQEEGALIDYVELINKSNVEVLEALNGAHIVLNQFYSFAPGLLGIEAMANYTAVLMSANYEIEPSLPCESKGAWLTTYYWQIYDHLNLLINNRCLMQEYAERGYKYAVQYHSEDSVSTYMNKKLKEVLETEAK